MTRSDPWPGLTAPQVIELVLEGVQMKIPEDIQQPIRNLIKETWAFNPDDRPDFPAIFTKYGKEITNQNFHLTISHRSQVEEEEFVRTIGVLKEILSKGVCLTSRFKREKKDCGEEEIFQSCEVS